MMAELVGIYDPQNSEEYRDEMTCLDPATGRRISVSRLLPRSAADLKRRRDNNQLCNELSWGQLGRSRDIVAPHIISALHLKNE
jgi:4-hydroxyphenylacetate 3-monooxygenase